MSAPPPRDPHAPTASLPTLPDPPLVLEPWASSSSDAHGQPIDAVRASDAQARPHAQSGGNGPCTIADDETARLECAKSTVAPTDTAPSEGAMSEVFPVAWHRYQYVAFLGAGGMGTVFRAIDVRLNRPVALKFIRGNDPDIVDRLRHEAQIQARVEHANICKVHEVGEVDGRPYIAMQLIEGQSLRRIRDALTLEQKLMLIRDVATALHAAHASGLIHRDVKPQNILVERSEDGAWHPYIMDFGLARGIHDPGQTVVGVIEGTPAFMAPEQARGRIRQLDRRARAIASNSVTGAHQERGAETLGPIPRAVDGS